MNENVLVSICVVSYNSETTILETLESALNQTYQNIELIISDDGSKDNTLETCRKWREQHLDRFVDIKILTVSENSGVPANCNRAVAAANGEWIKIIAADDCLLPNCISDNIEYSLQNPNILIQYTDYYCFVTAEDGIKKTIQERLGARLNRLLDTTPNKQLRVYIENKLNIMPSVFIKKDLFNLVGGFIEKYKLFEDTPFLTKVLINGIKIYHLPAYTVLYRFDNSSITRESEGKVFFKEKFNEYYWRFLKEMVFPVYKWYEIGFWFDIYSYRIIYLFTIKVLKNKRSKINNTLYYLFKSLNPYNIYIKLKRKILKEKQQDKK